MFKIRTISKITVRRIAAAFLLLGVLSSASAKKKNTSEGMYAKLSVGYASGSIESGNLDYSGIEIIPALGFGLSFVDIDPFSLALEASLGIIKGDGSKTVSGDSWYYDWDCDVTVLNPGVMAVISYNFDSGMPEALQKLVPYAGAGFSTPITFQSTTYRHYVNQDGVWTRNLDDDDSDYDIDLKINAMAGAHYDFTDNFSALVEANIGLLGEWIGSLRIGAMYRF